MLKDVKDGGNRWVNIPWSSSVVIVRKKTGDYQFCVEYGKPNGIFYQNLKFASCSSVVWELLVRNQTRPNKAKNSRRVREQFIHSRP
jgi:hypothetical protein